MTPLLPRTQGGQGEAVGCGPGQDDANHADQRGRRRCAQPQAQPVLLIGGTHVQPLTDCCGKPGRLGCRVQRSCLFALLYTVPHCEHALRLVQPCWCFCESSWVGCWDSGMHVRSAEGHATAQAPLRTPRPRCWRALNAPRLLTCGARPTPECDWA